MSGQIPSSKKKLGSLSFNYVQIADQTRRLKTFLRVLQKISNKANASHEFFKGWSGAKLDLKTKWSLNAKVTSFTRNIWTSKISTNLNSELCCKYGALNLLSTENLSNKKNSPVLFSDLKAIKGHSFSCL